MKSIYAAVLVAILVTVGAAALRDQPAGHQAPRTSTAGGYSRAQFGDGWADLDHDGCETRDEVLARDLTHVRLEDSCDVKAGTLHDPYTGHTIHFTDSAYWTVDIDHLYPLHLAWEHGADHWTHARRVAFANDPRNLLAVDSHSNRAKGDSGPGEWVPSNRGFACEYGRDFTTVAHAYDLTITQADQDSLDALATTCK